MGGLCARVEGVDVVDVDGSGPGGGEKITSGFEVVVRPGATVVALAVVVAVVAVVGRLVAVVVVAGPVVLVVEDDGGGAVVETVVGRTTGLVTVGPG